MTNELQVALEAYIAWLETTIASFGIYNLGLPQPKKLRSAIKAAQATQWKPISEAPDDLDAALVYSPDNGVCLGVREGGLWLNLCDNELTGATLFHPLPLSPNGGE